MESSAYDHPDLRFEIDLAGLCRPKSSSSGGPATLSRRSRESPASDRTATRRSPTPKSTIGSLNGSTTCAATAPLGSLASFTEYRRRQSHNGSGVSPDRDRATSPASAVTQAGASGTGSCGAQSPACGNSVREVNLQDYGLAVGFILALRGALHQNCQLNQNSPG